MGGGEEDLEEGSNFSEKVTSFNIPAEFVSKIIFDATTQCSVYLSCFRGFQVTEDTWR